MGWSGGVGRMVLQQCDSSVTAKWVFRHLDVEFMLLIIRCLLVYREGCDRCDSKK